MNHHISLNSVFLSFALPILTLTIFCLFLSQSQTKNLSFLIMIGFISYFCYRTLFWHEFQILKSNFDYYILEITQDYKSQTWRCTCLRSLSASCCYTSMRSLRAYIFTAVSLKVCIRVCPSVCVFVCLYVRYVSEQLGQGHTSR